MLFDRRCPGCGEPNATVCGRCRQGLAPAPPSMVPGLDTVTGAFAYDDHFARLLLAAKNGGRRDVLRILATPLCRLLPAEWPLDVVTWVPASRLHLRHRGYDQGRILAAAVGRQRSLGHRRLLRRRGREAQARRSRHERLAGPVLRPAGRVPATVLLVDDVSTTGTSLSVAAAELRAAGANTVHGAVLAVASGDDGL